MKNKRQVKVLQNEYLKDRNWSKSKISNLARILGLSECQVYKWNWDQKLAEKKYLYETFYATPERKEIFIVEKVRYPKELFTIVKN